MLRRAPTRIAITQDDVARFDDARQQRARDRDAPSSSPSASGRSAENSTPTKIAALDKQRSAVDRIMGAAG